MTRRVRVTPEARLDILRLADFLKERSPSAARRAVATIKARLRTLATFPERGRQTDHPGRRELPIPFGAYGYLVRYRIAEDEVVVFRVFHSREDR